jgi:hypothetical protein
MTTPPPELWAQVFAKIDNKAILGAVSGQFRAMVEREVRVFKRTIPQVLEQLASQKFVWMPDYHIAVLMRDPGFLALLKDDVTRQVYDDETRTVLYNSYILIVPSKLKVFYHFLTGPTFSGTPLQKRHTIETLLRWLVLYRHNESLEVLMKLVPNDGGTLHEHYYTAVMHFCYDDMARDPKFVKTVITALEIPSYHFIYELLPYFIERSRYYSTNYTGVPAGIPVTFEPSVTLARTIVKTHLRKYQHCLKMARIVSIYSDRDWLMEWMEYKLGVKRPEGSVLPLGMVPWVDPDVENDSDDSSQHSSDHDYPEEY